MTIEIADRLVKLRKQKGLSQEELADKLGLSRQAVSKWERAEASPDTDNLICLAKLYGVSLDELLNTDEDIDTIVKEQVREEVKEENSEDPEQTVVDDNEKFDDNNKSKENYSKGIHLTDDEGNSIHIGNGKVELHDKNGHIKVFDKDQKVKKKEPTIIVFSGILEGILFLLAAAAFILLGSLHATPFGWSNAWIMFFVPEIICSVLRAIGHKKFSDFNMAFVATFIYFLFCMVLFSDANIWHPMWVVFLAIPIYYAASGPIDKFIHKDDFQEEFKKCCSDCNCEDKE